MSALKKISDKFSHFDDWHHVNKFSLVLIIVIFAAIPLTVFTAVTLRQVNPQAASGSISSLTPAYSSNTTSPTFRWDCLCYANFRIYLREGNNQFWENKYWYKDVSNSGSSSQTTNLSGFKNYNNYGSPPTSLKFGTTYHWKVACVPQSGQCTSSPIQAFTVLDKTPPVLTMNATNITTSTITWVWSATDNVGISGYFYCQYSPSYVDPQYYKDVNPSVPSGGASGGGCAPTNMNTSLPWSGLLDNTTYAFSVKAFDTSNNVATVTKQARTLKKDSDGDSFGDAAETHMGTSPNAACGTNTWPPDFNNDKKINSGDQILLARYSNTDARNSTANSNGLYYTKRYDLNLDGYVNSGDQSLLASHFGKTCT